MLLSAGVKFLAKKQKKNEEACLRKKQASKYLRSIKLLLKRIIRAEFFYRIWPVVTQNHLTLVSLRRRNVMEKIFV